jgi:sarcosine oxidase
VIDWTERRNQVEVRTDRQTYTCHRLVITAGAWAGKVLADLQALLTPERQVMLWVQPRRPQYFQPATFPVFYMQTAEGSFYGFPVYSVPGFKIGKYHHLKQEVDPDTIDRECHAEDERILREGIRRYFPDANGATMAMKACMFTNTRDEHFIIERRSGLPAITFAAGFSGHGFKFCSVVGEILAELVLDGGTRHDISLFASSRLFEER